MAIVTDEASVAQSGSERRLSPRVERLLARLQAAMLRRQEIWQPESILSDPAIAGLPLVLRRAHAGAAAMDQMPIEIDGDELIVGRSAIAGVIQRVYLPEFASPEEHARAEAEGAGITAFLAHKTPDYPAVPQRGLRAILDEIAAKAAELSARPDSAERTEKLLFMESMRVELEATIRLAHRHAALAEALADTADPVRAAELRRIAAVCRRVPEFPALTFQEAVQGVWFVHLAFTATRTELSLGRLDQYLGPLLAADLASGRTSEAEAQEIADCLWLKFNDRASLRREDQLARVKTQQTQVGYRFRTILATDLADALNHFGQNILLSGITPAGVDGTNQLTYLLLNCMERFEFTSPVVTVRLHRRSPAELVRRCAEVLKKGSGMPYIDNDDVLIKSYEKLGVPTEDARDYANSNCWETMIAGKSDQELIRGINFLLVLEWALNRGVTRCRGQEGIDTGDPLGFRTFDDLMGAWKQQLDTLISRNIDFVGSRYYSCDLYHSGHGKYSYSPLLSSLTQDCVASEADVIRGGARYVIWHVMGEAASNCIDAMAAIRQFVYDDRTVSMSTVLSALQANWKGYEDLRQQMLARAAKFANDNEYADRIGRELLGWFVDRTRFHAARYPRIIFPCSVGTFSWYPSIGTEVGASCDGRFAGEPIAPNFSPVFGSDLNGPTSAIKSYVQMSMSDLAAGAPMDLRFAGSGLRGAVGTDRLRAFIQAFIALGGNMTTITVTDVDTLRKAMEEPEKYRGLRVRMGGWSAYFVALSREQQLLHISKVEHGLA